jgi:hypothetical protein
MDKLNETNSSSDSPNAKETILSILKTELQSYTTNNKSGLTELLQHNAQIKKEIHQLYEIKKELKLDAESASARDDLLRHRDTHITPHSLFLLDRPILPYLIPYLWAISVLFIGVGIIVFKELFPISFADIPFTTIPSVIYGYSSYFITKIFAVISNPIFISILLISMMLTIVGLSIALIKR